MVKYRTKLDEYKDNKDVFKIEVGPNGYNLCRYCHKDVLPPRRTLCSKECAHQWNIITNWNYAKKAVYYRDHGICAVCKMDCIKVLRDLKKLPKDQRFKQAELLGIPLKMMGRKLYDVDHIVPVYKGGGCANLSGLQTLCWKCHLKKSALEAAERALIRKQNKTKVKQVKKRKISPK